MELTRALGRRAVLEYIAVAACALLAGSAAVAQQAERVATDTPAATIDSLHRGLVELSHDAPSADLAMRYRALEPLITATHDLPYIAELALRRQWPSLSAAERARFVAAFTKLSVTTYAARFKNVTAATFKAAEPPAAAEAGQEKRAQVRATIVRPGDKDVPLEYSLQQRDGAWKIVNIVADGVSDLALKRAEYQRVLTGGTIDDLIDYLGDQTAALEKR